MDKEVSLSKSTFRVIKSPFARDIDALPRVMLELLDIGHAKHGTVKLVHGVQKKEILNLNLNLDLDLKLLLSLKLEQNWTIFRTIIRISVRKKRHSVLEGIQEIWVEDEERKTSSQLHKSLVSFLQLTKLETRGLFPRVSRTRQFFSKAVRLRWNLSRVLQQ